MGNTESIKETETNQNNNVYLPNMLAKQIIGDVEVSVENKKDKIISDTSLIAKNSNNNKDLIIKDNINNEKDDDINKTKELETKKSNKAFANNIFSDVNKGKYFNIVNFLNNSFKCCFKYFFRCFILFKFIFCIVFLSF